MTAPNNIRNLHDLEDARAEIRTRLREREKSLGRDLSSLKEMSQPMNLFALGLHAFSPADRPLDSMLLAYVRRLKAWLQRL